MPLYEYECQQCHRRVEKIQKFADAPLTVCPHCSGQLERTITAPAIQFKGAGWYKDLYSSAKPTPADSGSGEKAPAAAAGDAGAASSSSGDKPAASAPAPSAAPSPASSSGGTGS